LPLKKSTWKCGNVEVLSMNPELPPL
jgi:hypothetical protein